MDKTMLPLKNWGKLIFVLVFLLDESGSVSKDTTVFQMEPELQTFLGTLEQYEQSPNEVVFVLDESGSIEAHNFPQVKNFTELIARQLAISPDHSRVGVITFATEPRTHLNYIKNSDGKNMCTFIKDVDKIDYVGDYTHTDKALRLARDFFKDARNGANRIIILLTDGQSTAGHSPVDIANELKRDGVIIFAVGVANVNEKELEDVATSKNHIYILRDFQYIYDMNKYLRGAITEVSWDYTQDKSLCNSFCTAGTDCCDDHADCYCGTKGGNYECVCSSGYSGSGHKGECRQCSRGTYKSKEGVQPCTACPENSTTVNEGSTSITSCQCKFGHVGNPAKGTPCKPVECAKLSAPEGGVLLPQECTYTYGSQCSFKCSEGYCPYQCNETDFSTDNSVLPWNILPGEPRVCLDTGLWTGTDFHCEKVRCSALNFPSNGNHNCSHLQEHFTFNTVCHLACDKGYTLTGSQVRTCQIDGSWSGEETFCSAVKCKMLKTNDKLKVKPHSCGMEDMVYRSTCQYYCQSGFHLASYSTNSTDIGIQKCQADGKWSGQKEKLACEDATHPDITCPRENLTVRTDPHVDTGLVSWQIPTATDNVFVKEVAVIHPPGVYKPPHIFPIGSTKVVYQAKDSSGLKSTCTFTVTVIDVEPPQVKSCPADLVVYHFQKKPIPVNWNEPVFVDNSKTIAHVSSNRKSGDSFQWGPSSLVTYKASDPSGNTATCSFTVKVKPYQCAYTEPPVNGFLTCDTWLDGVLCKVYCNAGHRFVETPEEVYFCSQKNRQWGRLPGTKRGSGPVRLPWPDCAKPEPAAAMNVGFDLKFSVTDCSQSSEELEKLKELFIEHLKKSTRFLPELCSKEHGCEPKNVNITCGQAGEPKSRKKRNIQFVYLNSQHLQHSLFRRSTPNNVLHITFSFAVPEEQTVAIFNATCEDCNQGPDNMTNPAVDIIDEIAVSLKENVTNIVAEVFSTSSPVIQDINYNILTVCHMGQILINNICVNCPVGTYFHNDTGTCLECSVGFYQDAEGTFACHQCPNGTSTLHARAKNIADCKAPCKPGTFSSTRMEPCVACPQNTYQEHWSAKDCKSCPSGLLTLDIGSSSASDCARVCPPGSFSQTGYQPCVPCSRGSYQPKIQQTSCLPCPSGETTIKGGAHIKQYCRVVDFCEDLHPCYEGSSCINLQHSYECVCEEGRIGKNCEIDVDDCSDDLCHNNGTCIDQLNNFTCICMPGFTGSQCEINIDDCTSSTCQNGGKCTDLTNDYSCVCPKGFTGKNCEINFNDCSPNPCQNGGTCFDMQDNFRCCCPEGFTGSTCESQKNHCEKNVCFNDGTCIPKFGGFDCSCHVGFAGNFCETNIDDCTLDFCENDGTCVDEVAGARCECPRFYGGPHCEEELTTADFEVSFLSPVTSNYIDFPNDLALHAITMSFFMQTRPVDDKNQGTPVSYSYYDAENDITVDNALTLMDPSQLVLYIHGISFHTKYAANSDSNWHHYAVTWDKLNGDWSFYVDSQVIASGTGVGVNKYLWPGMFVLGQEQDSVGGSFSVNEAFVGAITQFNVWDYALSAAEIKDLSSACDFVGNLISWPYAKLHSHGDLVFSDSSSWCASIGVCSKVSCHCITTEESTELLCKRAVSSCSPNPCANNQKCNDTVDHPYCDCEPGYDGKLCEHDVNECLVNNGKCSHMCENTLGSYKCNCPHGMVLMENAQTCKDVSYCQVNNQIFVDGDVWRTSCRECQCKSGDIFCVDLLCSSTTCKENETMVSLPGSCCDQCILQSSPCSVWSNNTFVTFDSMVYEFRGNCRYTLVEDCITGNFSIHFEPVNNGTVENHIIIHVQCVKVSISSEGSVLVNGKKVSVPFKNNDVSIQFEETSLLVWGHQGFLLQWHASGSITLSVPESFQNHLCGLCGNFNGDPFDDKVSKQHLPLRTASGPENCVIVNNFIVEPTTEAWTETDSSLQQSSAPYALVGSILLGMFWNNLFLACN